MTDAILTETMIQFVCQVNEAMFSFDNMIGNKETARESISTRLFSGTDVAMIIQNTQIALAGLSLSYKYVGSESGKTMSIDFSNQELREGMQLDMMECSDSIAIEEHVDTLAIE